MSLSPWVRAGALTVQLDHVLAIETRVCTRQGPGGETVARPLVRLYLSLPSPHDGLPWVVTAEGADAYRLARLADRLADPAGCDGCEQDLRDGGLGDMASAVDCPPPPF